MWVQGACDDPSESTLLSGSAGAGEGATERYNHDQTTQLSPNTPTILILRRHGRSSYRPSSYHLQSTPRRSRHVSGECSIRISPPSFTAKPPPLTPVPAPPRNMHSQPTARQPHELHLPPFPPISTLQLQLPSWSLDHHDLQPRVQKDAQSHPKPPRLPPRP